MTNVSEESAFDALGRAGRSAGDVARGAVGDFTQRLRAGQDSSWARMKETSTRTLRSLAQVRSAEELRATTTEFADAAEAVLDELTSAARGAAQSARQGEDYAEAQEALTSAAAAMRITLNDATDTLRREGSRVGSQLWDGSPKVAALRERLDGLLGQDSRRADTPAEEHQGRHRRPEPDPGPGAHPEVIDGEVLWEERP